MNGLVFDQFESDFIKQILLFANVLTRAGGTVSLARHHGCLVGLYSLLSGPHFRPCSARPLPPRHVSRSPLSGSLTDVRSRSI